MRMCILCVGYGTTSQFPKYVNYVTLYCLGKSLYSVRFGIFFPVSPVGHRSTSVDTKKCTF